MVHKNTTSVLELEI